MCRFEVARSCEYRDSGFSTMESCNPLGKVSSGPLRVEEQQLDILYDLRD